MNDFTKEELEIIKDGLEYVLHEEIMKPIGWDVLKKLQYIIDNFKECHHESDGGSYALSNKLTLDGKHFLHHDRCVKCGEFYR